MKNILLSLSIYLLFSGCTLTNLAAKGAKNHKITILDQKQLTYPTFHNIPFSEISDIAYSPQEQKVYMVGDKGYFYIFSASFSNKIKQFKYLSAYPIKNHKAEIIHPDIEGLTFTEHQELIASFERQPQIAKITKQGRVLKNYKLPKKLRNKKYYKDRNSIFEALAYHPRYGILTAAEHPIKPKKNNQQTIYSLQGKSWHFNMENYPNIAITAMEVMDDNNLLIIERAYNGLSQPFIVVLTKVYLNQCDNSNLCQTQHLATFNSADGWGYNNFEGLAKVGKNRYIMISDNNNLSILPTTLLYFKVN